MTLVRWNPALSSLSRWPTIWEDEDFQKFPTVSSQLDVSETENEVIVKANVAGVQPEQVDVTFEKGILWIQANAQEEEKNEKQKFYSKSSWNYSYKVAVPGEIDFNQDPIAEVENGVVTITFRKAEASKPKKLTIQAKRK